MPSNEGRKSSAMLQYERWVESAVASCSRGVLATLKCAAAFAALKDLLMAQPLAAACP